MNDPADTLYPKGWGEDEPAPSPASAPARAYPELSPREYQVAEAIASGLTNREIATALTISIKTVDTHRGHVLKKLGCKNNVALVRLMIRDGVVQP